MKEHVYPNMRCAVVFAYVCAMANHQVCIQGVTETVEVTRTFHAQ